MSDLLKLNIRRTSKELSSLAALIGQSSESKNKYHGLLEDFGEVFQHMYATSVNDDLVVGSAIQLLNKAQRLNDSGDNLNVKQMTTQFATRIKGMKSNELSSFISALKKADIKDFIDLLTRELQISLEDNPPVKNPKLELDIRHTTKELTSLASIIGKTSESKKKYHGLLEALGGVFEHLYSPSVNINALNSAAEQLLDKAQRLNHSGENLEVKRQTSQFATRLLGLRANGVREFVSALKKADIKSFIDLLTQELGISLGIDPVEAARRRKAAEEADRKRREAEEAARKRKEAEETARRRREAEEAERKRREAEALRRRLELERQRKEEQRRKRVRIIRNSLIFAVAAAALWWFWLKDFIGGSSQPDHYVYVENLTLRSTPESGSSGNAIELLPYGTPVQVVDTVSEGWCKVKVNGKSGYVSSFYLMDTGQFNKLDSIFEGGNEDIRQLVPTSIYRKALVDFAEREAFDGNDYYYQWVLYNQPDRGYNNVSYPNLPNGYDIVPDFAFIVKDKYVGQRKVVLYSIDADSEPVFIHSEEAQDFPVLKRVTYNKKKKTYGFEYVTEKTPVNRSQLVPDDSGLTFPTTSDASAKTATSGSF